MLDTILEYRKGILFVRLKGELTKKTIAVFEKQVLEKILKGGIYHIVYNLEELTKIDKKGYHKLLYCYEICNKHQGKIFLLEFMPEEVKQVLKVNHIKKYIPFIKSELDVFERVMI